jgi:hypothetical protein
MYHILTLQEDISNNVIVDNEAVISYQVFFYFISVDTEMCCPKDKCGCQYFILLTLKKKIIDTGVLDFLNKKLILDYYLLSPVLCFYFKFSS